MKSPPIIGYIRRFGFWRGIYFRNVAAKCDKDPHLLLSWSTHFQARASREFNHGNSREGHVFLAFAEMLRTTYDSLVLKKTKLRRPILSRQMQRLERHLQQRMRQRRA